MANDCKKPMPNEFSEPKKKKDKARGHTQRRHGPTSIALRSIGYLAGGRRFRLC